MKHLIKAKSRKMLQFVFKKAKNFILKNLYHLKTVLVKFQTLKSTSSGDNKKYSVVCNKNLFFFSGLKGGNIKEVIWSEKNQG